MPKPYTKEFRDDVVAIARRPNTSLAQIAKDFGISETCVQDCVRKAEAEGGIKPGSTAAANLELREARKRIRLLEQENEVLRRAAAYLPQGAIPR